MSGVDIKKTLAYQIALKLDNKDESSGDGKINKSIWDAFVQEFNGKKIEKSITIDQAIRSITTYLIRKASGLGTTADEIARKWLKKDINDSAANQVEPIEIDNTLIEHSYSNPIINSQQVDLSDVIIEPLEIKSSFSEEMDEEVVNEGMIENFSNETIDTAKLEIPLSQENFETPVIKSQVIDLSSTNIESMTIETPFVVQSNNEQLEYGYDSKGHKYHIEKGKDGEKLVIYELKNGAKRIINYGTEIIPSLKKSYNIGDAKVTVQSNITLNENGKIVFDENGFAGTITVEKNGEKIVVPLEINMPLGPNSILDGKDIYINFNEKMEESNALIQMLADKIFQGLSSEALDYFTKECDILRFNQLDSNPRLELGKFDYIDDNDTRNGKKIAYQKANRLILNVEKKLYGNGSFYYTNVNDLQETFLHELGHGVSSYTVLPTSESLSELIDLSTENENWAKVYDDICKYVRDNNLSPEGCYDYPLSDKKEFFAEFFAYSMGVKADGQNYATLFATIKNQNPELISKANSALKEILTKIDNLETIERKYSIEAYKKYYEEQNFNDNIQLESSEALKNDFKITYNEIMKNNLSKKVLYEDNQKLILDQIDSFINVHVGSYSEFQKYLNDNYNGSIADFINDYSKELVQYGIGSQECKSILTDVFETLMEKYINSQ